MGTFVVTSRPQLGCRNVLLGAVAIILSLAWPFFKVKRFRHQPCQWILASEEKIVTCDRWHQVLQAMISSKWVLTSSSIRLGVPFVMT